MSRDAVFRSWQNDRAKHYRRINNIDDMLGTAVNVQAMVFGNLGDTSGTGVGFTRNPANGDKEFYGEFLLNAQGEDVVSGVRTPVPILELEKIMPDVYNQLREITTRLEKHYKDMQDFEFTIQDRKLYMLQTRNGKRTGLAAVRVALQMVDEGLITKEEAIFRVDPNQLYDFLVPRLDEKGSKVEVLAKGLPASPGAAVGHIVFTADEAVEKAGHERNVPVILVRAETTPEDIHGMEVAKGILTSRGGMTSHAAVVTRGMGKCCVAGAGDIDVDEKKREMRVKGQTFKAGDWISLDGTTGRVIKGKLNTLDPSPDDPELQKFMDWADPYRTIKVRANADIPRDAIQARTFGAEGIGLCRTEHMFFGEEKIPHMRAMILANNEKDRRAALKKLLPMQRKDFDRRLPCHGRIPGHHPHPGSATARVPAAPRRIDGRYRDAAIRGRQTQEIARRQVPRLRRESGGRSEEAHARAAQPRRAVARSSIPCSAIAVAVSESPIRKLPRCRRAPSSKRPLQLRRTASRCFPKS